MSSVRKTDLTQSEYLSIERQADGKHEFYRGEMFAMTGASRRHNLIAMNIAASLHLQLRSAPCEVYGSDMRVKVAPTGLYTYPDVSVACDDPQFDDAEVDTLLNPRVLLEVLSKSTDAYDRGPKFEQYRRLPSLKDYLLVSQDRVHVEHFERQSPDNWLLRECNALTDTIHLASIDCHLPLEEMYLKVDFATVEEECN